MSGYDYSLIWDKLFLVTDALLGGLIVVMFLFFSGYGVMYAIMKKGTPYINSIPKHRILNTLLNFDVAVFFFFILSLITLRPYTWLQVLLSLIAWDSIGNSSWYILAIVLCYLSTWLSFARFKIFADDRRNLVGGAILNSFILLIMMIVLYKMGKTWSDIVVCYPLGMFFALYKDKIENLITKKLGYAICLFGCMVLFVLSYACPFLENTQFVYWDACGWIWLYIRIISMIVFFLLLMNKVKIGNSLIVWLGANLFPLYIYQRIPLIIISTYITCNPFILFSVGFGLTCAIVPVYKKIQIKL